MLPLPEADSYATNRGAQAMTADVERQKKMEPDKLKIYADFMKKWGLSYLEVKKGDFHLILKGKSGVEEGPIEEISSSIPSGDKILEQASEEIQEVGNLIYVKSPLVGMFYQSPSPESPPFVEIGKNVKKGEPLCIIEAMKVMNEIKVEHSGIVKEILVENGNPVEYGQVLFVLEM